MTNILALGEIEQAIAIRTGEDWTDAFVFTDASGAPVALDGIPARLQIRLTASDNEIFLEASTDNGTILILSSGAVLGVQAPGAGYVVNDLVYAPVAGAIVPLTLEVTAIGPNGAIAGVSMVDPGIYAALPANPLPQGTTSGAGSGATFALTWVNNALVMNVLAASLPRKFVAGSYVYGIQMVAEGYTITPVSGALTLTDGVVQ